MREMEEGALWEVLNRIAGADDKAVATLFLHYQRSVYAYIRHLGVDDDAADEVLNDTFLVICSKPLAYDRTSSFHTWICAIAKYKSYDWLRRRGREAELRSPDIGGLEEVADPEWNVLDRLSREETDEALRECIARLPVAQREAIYWTMFEDASLDVAALRMGCPEGTVKSRLYHARLKLRRCMDDALGKGFRNE